LKGGLNYGNYGFCLDAFRVCTIVYNIIINMMKEKEKHHLRLDLKEEKAEISRADN
jgi:hypothetical protein